MQRWLIDIGTTIKIFLRPTSFLRFVERLKTCSCRQKLCITQFHTSYSRAHFKWEDILRHRGILIHLADTYIVAGTQLRNNCYANATTFLDEVCSLQMFTKVQHREKRDRRADKTFGAGMTPPPPQLRDSSRSFIFVSVPSFNTHQPLGVVSMFSFGVRPSSCSYGRWKFVPMFAKWN